MTNPPLPAWPYRIGRILQLGGLIIGLEAFLVFGFTPREGPMIYTALAAVAVFYTGFWLTRRSGIKGSR
jgi:hypothetical protein